MLKRIILLLPIFIALTASQALAGLEMTGMETLGVGSGVKSILIHPDGKRAYSINLEGMSVYEIDRESRGIIRKLSFVPHKGKGYNYKTKEVIDSYAEKPVEAHFTHNGRYLWVSLHNAEGVVVWDLQGGSSAVKSGEFKEAVVRTYKGKQLEQKQSVKLFFMETGKTPKIISSSPDGHYLFVSNWHSNTVSVIDIASTEPLGWKKVKDIRVRIPRGLAVTPDSSLLYIAEMGAEHIIEIDLKTLKKTRRMHVGLNPRHIILSGNKLYISLNLDSKLAVLNLSDGTVEKTDTCVRPRTIIMPKDTGIIFSVCYRGEQLQAFQADDLSLMGSWPSQSHPVGLDVYGPDNGKIEAWVANYSSGTLKIFNFKYTEQEEDLQSQKSPPPPTSAGSN